jgi:hypothetical protein
MAKQPRQQPIGFYGKFQPTGVDNSAAQRMQALAGLGETVAGVAEKFGIAKAEEKSKEQAVIQARVDKEQGAFDAELYREVGEDGVITYSGVPVTGSVAYYESLMSTTKAQKILDIDATLASYADQFPNDTKAYGEMATQFFKGMSSQLPPSEKLPLEKYFNAVNSSQYTTVLAGERAKNKAIASETYIATMDSTEAQVLRLVEQGRVEEADAIYTEVLINLVPGWKANGAVTDIQFANRYLEYRDARRTAQITGEVNRLIINNPDLDMDQKDAARDEYLKAFDEKSFTEYTPAEKKVMRAEVVTMLNNSQTLEKKKIQEKRILSYQEQNKNLDVFDVDVIYNTEMSINEKTVAVDKAIFENRIPKEEGKLRKAYLSSLKTLTASTVPEIHGAIIKKTYGALALEDEESFLIAVREINNEILIAETNGTLLLEDALSLKKQFNNLTQSREARAAVTTGHLASRKLIESQVSPSLQNQVLIDVFYNADRAINERNVELESEGKSPLTSYSPEVKNIYIKETNNAIDAVNLTARERTNEILSGRSKYKIITTRAEYDALDASTRDVYFIQNGILKFKKKGT